MVPEPGEGLGPQKLMYTILKKLKITIHDWQLNYYLLVVFVTDPSNFVIWLCSSSSYNHSVCRYMWVPSDLGGPVPMMIVIAVSDLDNMRENAFTMSCC